MECLRLKSPALSSGVGESRYQVNIKYFNITVLHIDPKRSSMRKTMSGLSAGDKHKPTLQQFLHINPQQHIPEKDSCGIILTDISI